MLRAYKNSQGDFRTSGGRICIYCSAQKEPKSLLPDTFSGLKMYPKYICSRAVPQVAHSASPRPIAGFRGRFVGGKGGKGESEGEEVRSRESRGAEGRGASGTEGREGEEGDEKGRGLA